MGKKTGANPCRDRKFLGCSESTARSLGRFADRWNTELVSWIMVALQGAGPWGSHKADGGAYG